MAKTIGRIKDREVKAFDLTQCEVKVLENDELLMIGSTADVDRDGEVIDVTAWDLKNFKKNPVILAGHNYREPAVAKATQVKVQDGKLMFKIKFPPEGDYPVADVYRKLYKGGFMNASSVGFFPLKWENGDGEKNPYRKFTEVELLELSLVTVPANPAAVVEQRGIKEAISKGVLSAEEIKTLQAFAKLAIGGEKNVNDVEKLHTVEAQAETEGTYPGSVPQGNPQPGGNEKAVAELKEKISAVLSVVEKLQTQVTEMGVTLANNIKSVGDVEARLVELKASNDHYLSAQDDLETVLQAKEISEIARDIF